ncbi:glutaredoxin family protein [Methylotenera sp.]|uniref:glutaredoxin family protein n=1 Tax=Methylotenera sp. TaxID=2051956 RepID=UPI00248A3AA6|nr:glutaredoxin family protein [Methylotenera sp.]MDI1299096.1 glutaredoxin family protein [Methylotenera sp.]
MITNLILYSTSHCHLCEQAEALLLKLSLEYELVWTSIEIADNASLYEIYEIKIPVLRRVDTKDEIFWPFNEDDIKLLLRNSEIKS